MFEIVSTGYFMVDFPIIENQIESFTGTVITYLPSESVIAPRPELLNTPTASRGRRAEISYTVPLMVTKRCWAWAAGRRPTQPIKNNNTTTGSPFLNSVIYSVILKQPLQSTSAATRINAFFAELNTPAFIATVP